MESRGRQETLKKSQKYVPRQNKKQQRTEKFKKHLGSTSEGQGFADKRKKKIKYEYLKLLQKEKLKKSKSDESHTGHSKNFRNSKQHKKGMNAFSSLVKQQKIQKDKANKNKQDAEEKRKDKEAAINASRKKRKQNYKLLCKRTSKGQPVMKTQMEFLLAKIEKQVNQT